MLWARAGLVLCLTFAVSDAGAGKTVGLDAQINSLDRARTIVEEKLELRRAHLEETLRIAAKLLRPQGKRAWVERDGLRQRLWRRGWLKRLLRLQKRELRALESELEALERNRSELERDRKSIASSPKPSSLQPPVSGAIVASFGRYRHRLSGARLWRSSLGLATSAGASVVAPADARVRFVGNIRGLGPSVILAHQDGWMLVLGGVLTTRKVGDEVARGQALARAVGSQLSLQVRLAPRGQSVDPRPYLAR